jgi:hypothetical protein
MRDRHAKQGRGLLFPQLLRQVGTNGVTAEPLPTNDFQSAVLYWDKFLCPTNQFIHMALPGEDTLIKEGLLIRPRATPVPGSYGGPQIVKFAEDAQQRDFAEADKGDPGFWALSGRSASSIREDDTFDSGRAVLIELVGALPLPPDGTPVENMLEFKGKRKDELSRLRDALDRIYLQVINSPDQAMALKVAVGDIDKAIVDLQKTSREWWKDIKLTDVKSLLGVAVGMVTDVNFQMPGIATLAGSVQTGFSIKNAVAKKLKADRSSPYWYAVSVQRIK